MNAKQTKWMLTGVAAAVVLAGVLLYVLAPRAHTTITEALSSRPEVFPGGQTVLLPLSSAEGLGHRLRLHGDASGGNPVRSGETEDAPCFLVSSVEKPGLSGLDVSYKDRRAMQLEVGGLLGSLGAGANESGLATLSLEGLRVRKAVGIPNPNGPCGSFDKPTRVSVITTEVFAKKVRLSLGQKHGLQVGGSLSDAGTMPSGSTSSAWQAESESSISGQDIVLSGATSDVDVTVVGPVKTSLGSTPKKDRVVSFPDGFDGNVTILGYDDRTGELALRADTFMYSQVPAGQGYRTCEVGKETRITAGMRCYFWLKPGNSAVAVWWELNTRSDNTDELVLVTKGYRTDFRAADDSAPDQGT